MILRQRQRFLSCLLLFLTWVSSHRSMDLPFQIKFSPQTLVPGAIFQVRVFSQELISRVEATLAEKDIVFYTTSTRRQWEGLAGIDLETLPGLYSLTGTVWMTDGRSEPIRKSLRILPKTFPTQHIQVKQKYVELDAHDSQRAAREARQLRTIWETVTSKRLWIETFQRPLSSRLTSGFGRRRIVNGKRRSPHSGVDLKARFGTPIKAANSGKVVLAQDLFFAGKTIILDHGLGLYTLYAHCSKMRIKVGDLVGQGEVIGEVGATGRVTGPHLHWACRVSSARVNPLNLTTLLMPTTSIRSQ